MSPTDRVPRLYFATPEHDIRTGTHRDYRGQAPTDLIPRRLLRGSSECDYERHVREVHRTAARQVTNARDRGHEIRGHFYLTDSETGEHGTRNRVRHYQHAVEYIFVREKWRYQYYACRYDHTDKRENLMEKY